jgi:8-oxo-dGTP diphosphatase
MKRLYPKQPIVGVGAIILKKGSLLLERRKNQPGKGKWSIPGGVVELGESIGQAVMRETKEETALDVTGCRLLDVVDSVTFDEKGAVKYHFVIIDYKVKVAKGKPAALSDAAELKWVPLGEVENYDLTDSFRLFFRKNRSRLEED